MPTEAQRAEAARVERVWPGCQVEAENATAPMENATERKQEYVHVLSVELGSILNGISPEQRADDGDRNHSAEARTECSISPFGAPCR
jgi:hypothetical protein